VRRVDDVTPVDVAVRVSGAATPVGGGAVSGGVVAARRVGVVTPIAVAVRVTGAVELGVATPVGGVVALGVAARSVGVVTPIDVAVRVSGVELGVAARSWMTGSGVVVEMRGCDDRGSGAVVIRVPAGGVAMRIADGPEVGAGPGAPPVATMRRASSITCGSIVTATPRFGSAWSTRPPDTTVEPFGITSSRTTGVSNARVAAAGSRTSTPPCAICFTSAASSAWVVYVMRKRTRSSYGGSDSVR
jgi:hypothetical protein